MNSKHSQQQSRRSPSVPSIILLIIFSTCFTQLVNAKISCISTSTSKSIIKAGSVIPLEFSGSQIDTTLSTINADLVCTSTKKSVLALGKGYDFANYSPNSPSVAITDTQINEASISCPTNTFHIVYTTSSLLDIQTAECNGSISFLSEKMAAPIDPPLITIPVPSITLTSTVPSLTSEPPVSEPNQSTTSPAATTDPTTSAPPVQTTNPTKPTTTPSTPTRTTKPPKGTSTQPAVPPPAGTTTPGRGGNGGGSGIVTTTDGASPSATTLPSSSASDLEKTSTTGPSTMLIAGASVGVVGAIFVILSAILVWRKKQQKKMSLDELFMGDSSLAAASGYSPKPIIGRPSPDEERGLSRNTSVAASRSGEMTQQRYGGSPPPLMPTQAYHSNMNGYYNEVEGPDHYQNQGQQSYNSPYNQSNYDYNSHGHGHNY